MGRIILTFKKRISKATLLEAASRLILQKNCSSNSATNL